MIRRWLALAIALIGLLSAASVRADPYRVLVAVSHARGVGDEQPLHHATEDADHVRDVLATLGGVPPEAAIRLVDPTPADLQAGLTRAAALAAQHAQADVTFLFYFSGHGDRDAIHLAGQAIAIPDLVQRMRAIPAALRIVVTDACRNDPTRAKGIVAEPAFALSGRGTAADGVVWLSAAENGEPAQESDALEGALFTHYWVSGLRGAADANGDGRITLAESYDYAYAQTLLRSARGSGVLQHPTAMFNVAEYSPIVLTQTFGAATRLEFPQSADARYFVYALGSRSLLGEIWSSPDRKVALAVPPGRYVVQRRGGDGSSSAAEIALAGGEVRSLGAGDFRDVPEELLAAKGGDVQLHPNEIALDVGGGTSTLADGEANGMLRYARVLGEWAVTLGAGGGAGEQHTAANGVTTGWVGLEADVERRWRMGTPTLALGLGAAGDFVWQTVRRNDATAVAAVGYPVQSGYQAFAPGPLVFARIRFPLGAITWAELGVRGAVLLSEIDHSVGPLWSVGGAAGVGLSF